MASARDAIEAGRADAFAARIAGVLNEGALALMLSIGHRTGLFDVMSRLAPSSSAEVAREAGLDARYVHEWLAAMVAAGVVELDAQGARYRLPPEHAASLTREARPNNLAVTAQWIPLLAQVEDAIVRCFERGGGVPCAAFERFHAVVAEESDQTVVAALLDRILPLVPEIREALGRGIDALDVGCGRGRALLELARAFPRSRFTGCDLSPEAVASARAAAAQRGLANVAFEVLDPAELGAGRDFGLVTAFDALHDQARPDQALAGIQRALRAGGVLLMQEIGGASHADVDAGHPLGTFLYTVSCLHCTTVSLAQGGAGPGAMWGRETALRMLAAAGFGEVTVHALPHDAIHLYYVARRPR